MAEEYVICAKQDLVSCADAIREVVGSSDEMVFPNGFIDNIQKSARIYLPEGLLFSSGTFIPATEGTGTEWEIPIAKTVDATKTTDTPVSLFAIYRKDGFAAEGGNSGRYLVSYVGLVAKNSYGAGATVYRNHSKAEFTSDGGKDTQSTKNYGLPHALLTTARSNCIVRYLASNSPTLIFSTYGTTTLEAGCEYEWFAFINKEIYGI